MDPSLWLELGHLGFGYKGNMTSFAKIETWELYRLYEKMMQNRWLRLYTQAKFLEDSHKVYYLISEISHPGFALLTSVTCRDDLHPLSSPGVVGGSQG